MILIDLVLIISCIIMYYIFLNLMEHIILDDLHQHGLHLADLIALTGIALGEV